MKWVTNAPANPDQAVYVLTQSTEDGRREALATEIKWRRQFVVGEPQASETLTVEGMRRAGMIGLYRPSAGA